MAINVLGWKDDKVIPYHVSEMEGKDKECFNLMLITKGQNWHYCAIKSLSALLRAQHSD